MGCVEPRILFAGCTTRRIACSLAALPDTGGRDLKRGRHFLAGREMRPTREVSERPARLRGANDAAARETRRLSRLLPGAVHCCADAVPAVPGGYVLLIKTTTYVCLELPTRERTVLAPGRFLYCGSAYGAGLRARLGRHMRSQKALHWHVDRLTAQGRLVGAWVFPDGRECDLWAALSALPALCRTHPVNAAVRLRRVRGPADASSKAAIDTGRGWRDPGAAPGRLPARPAGRRR